jgi:hypothetical protein
VRACEPCLVLRGTKRRRESSSVGPPTRDQCAGNRPAVAACFFLHFVHVDNLICHQLRTMADFSRLDAIVLDGLVACEQVEIEVAAAKRVLDEYARRARTARNIFGSPVSRLPDELLCIILACLGPDWETYHATSLITLTHVCQRWRRLALAMASLWINPTLYVSDEVREWIKRAKGRPLDIHYVKPYHGYGDGYDKARQAPILESLRYALVSSRTGWIDVDGKHEDLLPILTECTSRLISSDLEDLRIRLNAMGTRQTGASYRLPFGDQYVSTNPDKLRRLQLHNCYIRPDCFVFPTLTYLALTSDYRRGFITPNHLWQMLNDMPLLKTMILTASLNYGAWLSPSEVPSDTYQVIEMKQLEFIYSAKNRMGPFATILRFLHAPFLQRVDLYSTSVDDDHTALTDIPPMLDAVHTHAAKVGWGHIKGITMDLCDGDIKNAVMHMDAENADFNMEIPFDEEDSVATWLCTVANSLHWDNVTCFDISIDVLDRAPDAAGGSWKDIFARMSRLDKLKIRGNGALPILEALASWASIMLPALTVIVLERTDLGYGRSCTYLPFGHSLDNTSVGMYLYLYTSSRHSAGLPLVQLQLNQCGAGATPLRFVDDLRALLPPSLSYPPDIEVSVTPPEEPYDLDDLPWQR